MSSTRDEDIRNKRLFDIRTVERNIKKGFITRKDYERYLKSLADVSAQVAPPEESDVDTDTETEDDIEENGGGDSNPPVRSGSPS